MTEPPQPDFEILYHRAFSVFRLRALWSVREPDPSRLEDYQAHTGKRRGHWPSSSEISGAMLEFYKRPPESLS